MYRVKSRLITKSQAPSSGCAAKEAGRSISALRNVESGLRYRRLGSPLWRVVRAGRFNQFESNSSSRTAAIGITGCINWKHPCKYHKPIQLPVILKLRTNPPPPPKPRQLQNTPKPTILYKGLGLSPGSAQGGAGRHGLRISK